MSGRAPVTTDQARIDAFLFKRLVPLDRERHEDTGLSSHRSFSEYHFHWLPITTAEVPEASRHFPIVLADTQTPMLAVVVGLHRRQSLFIDRLGRWTGGYLPLYLRQMPFQIVRIRSSIAPAQPALCVDLDSALIDQNSRDKIIDGDGVNALAQDAVSAAAEFEQGIFATASFAQALERSQLAVSLGAIPEAADCLSLRALKALSPLRLHSASPQMLAPFVTAGAKPLLDACARSLAHFELLRRLQERHYADREAHSRPDL
jgi:SapC